MEDNFCSSSFILSNSNRAVRGKGFLKIIPFLIGIITGYIVAICVGIVDFTPIVEAAFFSMPQFVIPFINYTPNFSAILTIAPIALVTMAEHIGDHTALSTIIGKDLLKEPRLEKTLLGDGIATFIAGILGGAAISIVNGDLSVTISGMSLAAIVGILINLLLPEEKEEAIQKIKGEEDTTQNKEQRDSNNENKEEKIEEKV